MKTTKKETNHKMTPIAIFTLALFYTKGLYEFFCKSTAKIAEKILFILGKPELTDFDFQNLASMLWIVNHLKRKLEGICSISTSVFDNCFCKAKRKLKTCICSMCYAYNQQSFQNGLREHNILNGWILRNVLIPVSAFKVLKFMFPVLRIESFGDTCNVIQARNYIRIIKAFPELTCAIWSKNILIWEQAFQAEGKPQNTTYVHSSHKINKPDDIDLNRFDFVDHIFTVYTKDFAKKHNVQINCGGKKCLECIKAKINCYFHNTELFINELLK